MTLAWIPALKDKCNFSMSKRSFFSSKKKLGVREPDVLSEQIKVLLQKADQKLILMVRG